MLKCCFFFIIYILCVFVFGKLQACFPHLVDEFSTWMLKAWVMLLMWACAESVTVQYWHISCKLYFTNINIKIRANIEMLYTHDFSTLE